MRAATISAIRKALPLNLVIAVGVGLIVSQIITSFRWDSVWLHFGDIGLGGLLLWATRQVQRELARAEVDAILVWPERACAWTFIAVTLIMAAASLVSPGEIVAGTAAISAIGKVILIGLALSLRMRELERLETPTIQRRVTVTPAAAVLTSFAVTILSGWLLLSLPDATPVRYGIPTLDALFTSTSATCVTGLIVQDTPQAFGAFGLTVILLLIQVGGLGIMTLSGVFSVAMGQRVSMHQRLLARDQIIIQQESGLGQTLRLVAGYTFVCEAVGAALLFARWLWLGETPLRAAWLAVFHSVSAFCNAGFSLFSNSLEDYSGDWSISLTISLLILVGGIGFPVAFDLRTYAQRRWSGQRARLSLHSRLALVTSGILLVVGVMGFLILEANATLHYMSFGERLQASWFQSVTARTAGFNTVPMGHLMDATKFLLVILMFIGASPGSTGGGIKTSTFATLALLSKAMIYGRGAVQVFGREISENVRHRATAILVLFGGSVLVWTFLMAVLERGHFIDLLFETVSAFATVGLSTGVTPTLSALGKIALIVAMYMGRVGPLTIALALSHRQPALELRHPEEPVIVG
ncbi:MAG: TrkH family potassium uptake protein [Armatimonadota bacterium]